MAQTSDSLKLKQRNERLAKQKKRRDSLEVIFNSTHNYFEIALELNHENVPITDNIQFYATDGKTTYQAIEIDNEKFEFKYLPDSVKFGLEFDSIKLETEFIKRNFYKNGARLRFGYFDNILELKEKWESGQHEDDFNGWRQTEPYLDIIKNKKVVKAARRNKLRPIEFIVYSPTVFGDGINITYKTFRPK